MVREGTNSIEDYDFDPILKSDDRLTGDDELNVNDSYGNLAEFKGRCNKEIFNPKAIGHALFRRNTLALKQIKQEEAEGAKLKRVLHWYHLMGYGFASTVGAGKKNHLNNFLYFFGN